MAFAFITEAGTAGSSTGGTTGAVNTSGANLIVLLEFQYESGDGTISDSKGNTWTQRTQKFPGGGGETSIWDVLNPTVGSGHTFTEGGTSVFGGCAVLAFSGAHASSAFDQQSVGSSASSGTVQPGSVTPTEDNELLVFGAGAFIDGCSISSVDVGTLTSQNFAGAGGVTYGGGIAYEIQTTATARNPTFTLSVASSFPAANIATYKTSGVALPARSPWVSTTGMVWR